jgi:uncharacterized protein (TIGR00725 family)
MAYQIAVCGPRDCSEIEAAQAHQVGALLADAGAVVLCGGGGGVMAAVAAGARSLGGLVVGIRPDEHRDAASPDLSVAVMTNMGQARNTVIVTSADAVITIGGSWGTLSEIAFAMRRGDIAVLSLGGWRILDATGAPIAGPTTVDTPEEAVRLAIEGASRQRPR